MRSWLPASMRHRLLSTHLHAGRQLEAVFGTADLNAGKTLTLSEFLACLHASQVQQLNSRVTAKTYKAPPPAPAKRRAAA